jgi:hypothetical protein
MFADRLERPPPLLERQMHFVQSDFTPEIANEILNFICIPEHSFLYSILQNSKQQKVTRTQVKRTGRMIKGHHVIAPHFVSNFMSVMAARVVYMHGQFD